MNNQKRQTIMLVDDNQAILNMAKKILQENYEVYPLPSAERLLTFLDVVTPDLIVMDVSMPEMDGFEVLRILKANVKYADIPVIFLTSSSKEKDELRGLALGAVDYVTKPFSAPILLKRIENHLLIKNQRVELKEFNDNLLAMVTQKTSDILDLQGSVINTFAEIVECRDQFTGGHIHRTQLYMEMLIRYLMENDTPYSDEVLKWDNTDAIVASSKLHDLGKIFISDTILNKPGPLTSDEYDIIKTHVVKGVEIIGKMNRGDKAQPFLKSAEIIIGAHHERWDGSGYPAGLKKLDIPLLGRLMAIADVYDALISARPYKDPLPTDEAAKIIVRYSGSHFDPVLIDVFIEVEPQFSTIAGWLGDGGQENDIAAITKPE